MNKPDGIEQWAWDKAQEVSLDIHVDRYGSVEFYGAEIAIAHAIHDAVMEERESWARGMSRLASQW